MRITRERAWQELRSHGMGAYLADFERDVKPDADGMYQASDVLDWLGY
jgi:hypothetical protein